MFQFFVFLEDCTPLVAAAAAGFLKVVSVFLDKVANTDARDKSVSLFSSIQQFNIVDTDK